jgi:hypothetical protein
VQRLRSNWTLSLVVLLATVAAVWILVGGGSEGGEPPTPAAANPGLVGQTPAPTYTPHSTRNSTTLTADAAIRVVMSRPLAVREAILQGTVHAELRNAGDIPAIQSIVDHYARDYPVWVVTASGTFYPISAPVGFHDVFLTQVDYLDGYTGYEILHELADRVSAPRSPAAQPP